MPSTVTSDGPTRRTLTFSVDRSVVDEEIEAALKAASRNVRMKGFRPGKVPLAVVRKTMGDQVAEDVRKRIINREFQEAIKEHELHPVGEPEFNLETYRDEGDEPFTFEFALEVIPDFELVRLEDIPAEIEAPELTEEMVDREVMRIREQAATLGEPEEGAAIGESDLLRGTVVYTIDGEALEPREERMALPRHQMVDGLLVEGSADAFVGKHVGDTVTFEDVELPDAFEPAEHAGSRASVAFTVTKHQTLEVPELDEELLGRIGVESEDELRGKIREQLEAQLTNLKIERIDAKIQEWLLDQHEFELPARMATKAVDRRVHEYGHQLAHENQLEHDAALQEAEAQREEIREATHRSLKASFILSRIAKENELTATVPEAEGQIRTLAQAQGQDGDALVADAHTEGWLPDMLAQVSEQKVREFLRARADITEVPPDAGDTPTDDGSPDT